MPDDYNKLKAAALRYYKASSAFMQYDENTLPELAAMGINELMASEAQLQLQLGIVSDILKEAIDPKEQYEMRNPDVEKVLTEIGHSIGEKMPTSYGFVLLMFGYHSKELFYISNAERQGIVNTMREFIAKFEAN